MKAQLLKTPMTVTVTPINDYDYTHCPDCCNPEYTPFKEQSYKAVAHAFWDRTFGHFVAISRNGERLVVPVGFLSPWDVKEMGENLEAKPIHSLTDIIRYGREAFAKDALLMHNNINIEILSVKDSQNGQGLEVGCNFAWTLHGHVKPVRDFKQLICFSIEDPEEIIML